MWMFFESCWEQRPTVGATALSPPLSLTTIHHHNTHWKQKNTVTMIPHDPPAPSGSNWIGKCDHRTSRNRSRWFRCGDVFISTKLTCSLFYWLLFYLHRLVAHEVKRWVFYAISSCFCCSDGSMRRALTQAIRRYYFFRDPPSTHLVLAWFWTGGEDAPCAMVTDKRAGTKDRALSSVCWERECK